MSGAIDRRRHNWSEADVAPIVKALPPMPTRAILLLRSNLRRLELWFTLGQPFWGPQRITPAAAAKQLEAVRNQARALALKATHRDLVHLLLDGMEEQAAASHTEADASQRLTRTIKDLEALADGAENAAQRMKEEVRDAADMARHKESAETHLQRLSFQLFAHLCRLFPETPGLRMGRSHYPSDEESERGPLVSFTVAVAAAIRARHPELKLRALSASAVANTYRRWSPERNPGSWQWLRPTLAHQAPARSRERKS